MRMEKILIIDDNLDHRNAIQYILEKQNYIVIATHNGKTGLKLLDEHDDIRVIIVDLAMLELTGVDVLKIIKDRRQPLRRIVLTAYDGELSFTEAEELKVFSYLNKPIANHILLFTVKSALNDLYREKLEKELSIAKEWQELAQKAGDFANHIGNKADHILSQINLIKEELKNINVPTKSRFDEITGNLNQILMMKGKISAREYDASRPKKPKVFIGSSTESLEVARAIECKLQNNAEVTVWEDYFEPGTSILDSLSKSLYEFDFAVFILGADDFIISKDKPSKCPRDNIMFEIGLFMGHLGRSKVFMVSAKDTKIPSDFADVVLATYNNDRIDGSLIRAVSPTCTKIWEAMKKCSRQLKS